MVLKSRDSAARACRAFTLIELLLVVAIISLLISILLPTLGKSKDAAHTDRCAGNLRVLLNGYVSYTRDNSNQLPGANTADANSPNFHDWMATGNTEFSITRGKLWSYVNSMEAYKCPNHVYPWYLNSYAVNGMLNGEQTWSTANGVSTAKRHITSNMRSAEQLVFMEEDDYRGWNINSWMLAGTESFIDLPAANHSGGDNLGFLDAHVEYWAWLDKDLRTRPKHGSTGITFGFSDPGNLDWHRLAPVFRSWPKN